VAALVTVVIPCRNEARYIEECLASIVASDFPKERLEVLVVDGESDDGTVGLIERFAAQHPWIALLHNPGRTAPRAVNLGIRAARGEVILRMDAHSTYPPEYIRRCVEGLLEHEADNVGAHCVMQPKESTPLARAIAVVLAHRFGVGNAHFRFRPAAPRDVDTVPFGCYRRDVFDRVGWFNENLRRGQDMDFNLRLRAAGGRIVLLPDVHCYYHPRTTWWAFTRHNFWNGIWVFYPMRFGRVAFSLRHLVPGLFVLVLGGAALAGIVWPAARLLLLAVAVVYGAAVVVASVQGAWRAGRLRLALLLPLVFASLHLAYGAGTIVGLVRVLGTRGFWRALAGRGLRPADV
jgi:glycosyltransferase involved in cell wall biosynthesis